MTQVSTGSRSSGVHPSTHRVSRRRLLAAGTGAAVGTGVLVRSLLAQADPSPSGGHNPFSQPAPTVAGPERLSTLLAYVPQSLVASSAESGIHWYYADLAQQFDTLGISRDEDGPDEENEPLLPALMTLATASSAFQYTRLPEFTDAIGFNPLGVDQTLLVGAPPEQLTLFRANFDGSRLESAWQAAGYVRESAPGGQEFWTIGPDGGFEIEHPIQRVVFAAFNNVVLVDDDLLLCAPTRVLLEEALATHERGDGASSDPFFATSLPTIPGTMVSAMSVSPSGVGFSASTAEEMGGELNELISRSDAAVGPMPRFDGLITAVGAGAVASEDDANAGAAMVRIVTSTPVDAAQVLAVVEYRWTEGTSVRTSQPYTELMEITSMYVDGAVAIIDFQQVRSPSIWRDMIIGRDTLPFIPSDGA